MSLCIEAALELATSGTPVFPCLADKRPATPHGFKDACADGTALRELWRRCPGVLVGVPTGEVTGFDALDLDTKHNEAKEWWQHNRHRLPTTRVHRTRSGGLHLLFKHDGSVHGTAGKVALGVDTRGNGGYLVWWPASGFPVLSDAPLAPWPDWLLAELRPKPRTAVSNTNVYCGDDRWLRGLIHTVATAPEGQRNSILFWAACRAGEAIRAGKGAEDFVIGVLRESAMHAGLTLREAQQTIRSGIQRS
jgi:Bifunctional DNA primase/polymerase, N-terminal